jgi:phosphinothricin acetyltransferase
MSAGSGAAENTAGAEGVRLRAALEADLPAIQAIYAEHVLHGLGSFELEPPSVAELARRMADVRARDLPWLVAETGGQVRGYAYAARFRPRPAYRHTIEGSVYVATGQERNGIGRALLGALVAECERQGYRQMLAVIGDSANTASIRLHQALGFTEAGLLRAVGFKHGSWVDVVIMQRALGPGDTTLPNHGS